MKSYGKIKKLSSLKLIKERTEHTKKSNSQNNPMKNYIKLNERIDEMQTKLRSSEKS